MIRLLIFLTLLCLTSEGNAEENEKYSQYTYGGVGLIQTPTARFSYDGEFGIGMSTESPYNRLYAKMQFFPWMEAVVRYTEGEFLPYNPGSTQTWKDKGLDAKFRIINEGKIFPEIALGLTDIGGTGAYSSEYIVASKAWNDLDISLGLGWGRLGGLEHFNNPFGWFDSNRKTRGGYAYRGGAINLGRFFSGKSTSIFGGLEYFTPIPDLSLKVEYDTSDYSRVIGKETKFDETGNIFQVDSRINYALNYRLNPSERDKIDLSIGYVRGNTIYANFSLHSNLNFKGTPKTIIGAEKLRVTNLPGFSYQQLDKNRQKFLTNRIIKEMANAGFVTHRVIYNGDELAAEISQSRFLDTVQFFDLASRILANNALKNINTITIINIDQGIETARSSVDIKYLRKVAQTGPTPEDLLRFNDHISYDDQVVIEENDFLYPNLYWEIKPHATGTLQHQEKFYFWQLEALIHAAYSIRKGLYVTTDIGIDITNNFQDYTYHIPDGELHHVRQDRRLYLTEGKTGIRRLAVDYLFDINSNIKAKLSAGYLEWMYGGFGGEVLYMPDNKRWGIGVDAYYVKQREFNQRFSFRDYDTVTGFLTYYQDIPFYDMRLKISAGKFLAKDVGAHIDLSRRFKTGARVGGIVALTDCDSDCVGEGSFNKWIYFELPMELFFNSRGTRGKAGYSWSPLTKDAGSKVEPGNLYNLVMNANDEVDATRLRSWSVKKILAGFKMKPNSISNPQ